MLAFVDPEDTGIRGLGDKSCQLLDEFINRGSTPAQFRK